MRKCRDGFWGEHELDVSSEKSREFEPFHVYALLCGDNSAGYIKIGISGEVKKRVQSIRTGIPIPMRFVCTILVDAVAASDIEKALHERFSDRRTSGEWFKFDFTADADKKEFNEGCREVFSSYSSSIKSDGWEKSTVTQFLRNPPKEREKFREERFQKSLKQALGTVGYNYMASLNR